MFYRFDDGSSLSAGKAYLQIPAEWMPLASMSVGIRFDDGETTGIDEVVEGVNDGKYYDLSGRVVEKPVKGGYKW